MVFKLSENVKRFLNLGGERRKFERVPLYNNLVDEDLQIIPIATKKEMDLLLDSDVLFKLNHTSLLHLYHSHERLREALIYARQGGMDQAERVCPMKEMWGLDR